MRFTRVSGVESIPGLLFTGLKVLLAAVYFVLCGAVAALTSHAFILERIGKDWIGRDWIGGSGVDWFNVHPVACRSLCFCLLELNIYKQDQPKNESISERKYSGLVWLLRAKGLVLGCIHTRKVIQFTCFGPEQNTMYLFFFRFAKIKNKTKRKTIVFKDRSIIIQNIKLRKQLWSSSMLQGIWNIKVFWHQFHDGMFRNLQH